MVFVTGDCHGNFNKFSKHRFQAQNEMTKDDIVIVCGDFGIWDGSDPEQESLDELDGRSFTTVFVDGNHENFDRLYGDEFPVVDFHGGKAHMIRPSIFHLMRGHVYNFEGKKFWCFGGAKSHDISDGVIDPDDFETVHELIATVNQWRKYGRIFRINHLSWWEQELPSREEMDFGMQTLKENNFNVDYIITHCAPQDVVCALGFRDPDILTQYFTEIAHLTKFNRWYFGHYHFDTSIWGKFILHYDKIERIL